MDRDGFNNLLDTNQLPQNDQRPILQDTIWSFPTAFLILDIETTDAQNTRSERGERTLPFGNQPRHWKIHENLQKEVFNTEITHKWSIFQPAMFDYQR